MFYLLFNEASSGTHALRVAGLSLVKRAVMSAQGAGFNHITVCLNASDVAAAQSEIDSDGRISASISWETKPDPPAVDPDKEIVVAIGNRVWTAAAMDACKSALATGVKLRGLVDQDTNQQLGLYRLKAGMWDQLHLVEQTTGEQLEATWTGGESALELVALKKAFRIVTRTSDSYQAETVLLQSMVKDADGVIARNINRKISLAISRRLARTDVHPNQVTAVVLLVGICAGPFAFFLDSYLGFVLGALCYYVSAILDGCDGELSRLKHLGSPLGAWLDTVTDDLVCFSYILGLYGRLALDNSGPFWLWVGIIGIGFYLLTILPRYYVMVFRLNSGDYQKLAAKSRPEKLAGFAKVADGVRNVIFRTDFLPFYAFVTALVGFVPAFAVPFAAGSIASAIDSLMTVAKPIEAKEEGSVSARR